MRRSRECRNGIKDRSAETDRDPLIDRRWCHRPGRHSCHIDSSCRANGISKSASLWPRPSSPTSRPPYSANISRWTCRLPWGRIGELRSTSAIACRPATRCSCCDGPAQATRRRKQVASASAPPAVGAQASARPFCDGERPLRDDGDHGANQPRPEPGRREQQNAAELQAAEYGRARHRGGMERLA